MRTIHFQKDLLSRGKGVRNMKDLVSKARGAQPSWAKDPIARSAALSKVAKVFLDNREVIIKSMVDEVKKPLSEARGEFGRAVSILEYYAQAALDPHGNTIPTSEPNLILAIRRAHGIASLVTPWNFPVAIPLWKAAPAFAMGNTILLKPSEFATETAQLIFRLISEVLPDGVFQVIPGDGEVGKTLIAEADVVSFTGSVKVGKQVVAQAISRGIPVQAEMGGHNPAIVLPDADLGLLASQFPTAAFSYSGQKCTATRRVIVVGDKKRRDEVAARLVAVTEALQVGPADDEKTFIAPLINSRAVTNYSAAIERARKIGKVLTGGEIVDEATRLVRPTVTVEVPHDDQLMCEEVFAPIVHMADVPNTASAIKLANSVPYGLTASIHTQDLAAALQVSARLITGMVKVNAPTAGVDFHAPFGGTKDSSFGPREQGKLALEFYSRIQTVTLNGGNGKFPC
ncbi:MAG: aldehyde dehydrogenase [Actinobacteria bacterium]|nr:aldehyde dehydrogenase [Actinomycetota bacterium]